MFVKDVMSASPKSVTPETSIAEAMSMMRFYQCDGLPVVVDMELVGFVQLRDVLAMFFTEDQDRLKVDSEFDLRRLQNMYAPIVRATVKQVMDKSTAVSVKTTVNQAINIMLNEQTSRLAVTEDNRLVGVISFDDVNKTILGLTSTRVAA